MSLVVVIIIRRFGFGPIYTNLIVTIVVAQAVSLFSSTPGLFYLIDFGVGLCWVVLFAYHSEEIKNDFCQPFSLFG